MRLLPATILILGALATAGCGDRDAEAPAALPPSGTAYRKLDDGDRLAVAAACRDRAAAKAHGAAAAAELTRVDTRALRDELDAAFALIRNQPRPVAAICEQQLPFVTPGLTLRFDGAKDGAVEFTYETNSDKPLTIKGAVSPPRPGIVTMRRAYASAKTKTYTAQIAEDGQFTLPTQRLRKIANNTFTLSFNVPPSAPRKAYFTAICLDCLAGAPPPTSAGQ